MNNSANDSPFEPRTEIKGPWAVRFDPRWGGPVSVPFERLSSWATHANPGIKYYSGSATYETKFESPTVHPGLRRRLILELGNLRELAEVRINGQSCGIVWMPPFRLDITRAVKPGINKLEVEVVNFWPNRIIGDQFLAAEKQYARTNVRKFTRDTPLMESGLLGPVRLGSMTELEAPIR